MYFKLFLESFYLSFLNFIDSHIDRVNKELQEVSFSWTVVKFPEQALPINRILIMVE